MMFLELPPEWMSRISRFSIATKVKVTGHHKGSHRSQRFGTSLDFSDFKEYYAGDDIRLIDWNVYARTERVYIKRFMDEQEMRVGILLDSSKSMAGKWLFARQLGYSLGLMALSQDDRLSVSAASETVPLMRKKGKKAVRHLEQFFAGSANLTDSAFTRHAYRFIDKSATVLFLISDGLEPIDDWDALFRKIAGGVRDIRFIQISTEEERSPEETGDIRFIDEENESVVNVTVNHRTIGEYKERRARHIEELQAVCAAHGIHYVEIKVEDGIRHAIFRTLAEKKWIQ